MEGERASIIEVSGLRKVFRSRRRGDVVAVEDVGFTASRGEILGLLGPNGAGKTTTIKSICGLVTPDAGRISVDGVDAAAHPRRAMTKIAAVLEGNRNVYWRLTPRENLEFFAALQGIPRRSVKGEIDTLIERFGLGAKRSAEARTLSRGMQQKLAVACAFVKGTPVLLLDEPTLGLDVETSHELRTMLRDMAAAEGRTILLSSHDMEVVQDVCQRVLIVSDGRVVTADRVDNLLDLFRVRAYRFTVEGSLGDRQQELLRTWFPALDVSVDGGRTTIDVELLESARFYDLVDALRRAGAVVESVDRRDPNLGEVFLKIVRGEVRR